VIDLLQDLVGRSNTVALDFGRALFGPIGGTVFALMVAISCFGALNGMSYSVPISYGDLAQKALFLQLHA
jgi:hypothetical protein